MASLIAHTLGNYIIVYLPNLAIIIVLAMVLKLFCLEILLIISIMLKHYSQGCCQNGSVTLEMLYSRCNK